MVTDNDKELFEKNGWEVECESPLEIWHTESGCRVDSGFVAHLVLDNLKEVEAANAIAKEAEANGVTNKEIMDKLNKMEAGLADDSFNATMVASDFLCYLQETEVVIPLNKEDIHGSADFLQGFFNYMAMKINRFNLETQGTKLKLVKSDKEDTKCPDS